MFFGVEQVEQNGIAQSKHDEDARAPVSSAERIVDLLLDARNVSVSGGTLAAVVVVAALAGAGICSLLQRQR
jgi:hypothetical protein